MAVGDDAAAAGYPLVPSTGSEDARVKFGAREINRTRDFVAAVKALIENVWPVAKGGTGATTTSGARANIGITSGTLDPMGGEDGDVYFKIV